MQIIRKSGLDLSTLLVVRRESLVLGGLTLRDRTALAIATCGVGFLPFIPATWGSAVGVGIYLLIGWAVNQLYAQGALLGWSLPPLEMLHTVVMLAGIVATCVLGIWASSQTAKLLRQKDPKPVIIDEIAGQFITFLFVPFAASIWAVAAGFFLFRAFDIFKPYPAHNLESLRSGFGIMADDVVAGLYAALVLLSLTSLFS